ncbi:LacI family DNA-binding transcriptional regulator [Microbacterium sp. SLBN-154]|uniref:LacI family DNA-binding transcriptional regulator n=1 Tax=Microbacterium sp. SLBN-154 TaxID=2768458 RepID=UPI001150B3EF|nr:LacI family DNA-binding transcriptional regulator [Microbacterium sp. SLBN-154]
MIFRTQCDARSGAVIEDDIGGEVTDAGAKRATLRDVAQRAGVSVATASKALNDRQHVSATTRARVREAADSLSFTPNETARSLLAGQTGTVGLITGDLEGRFSLPILMGAEDAFGAGRVSVLLCDARGDAIREKYHLDALLRRNVDGIIVVGYRTNPRVPLPESLPVPVVYAYAPSESADDVSVIPDDETAGVLAADHLLTTGRRRIAHISGDPDYTAATDRARGVEQRLADEGLPLALGRPLFGSWSEQWGRTATRRLLEADPEIDGIVCASDQIARGALDALKDLGRDVPRDVGIIGVDNWEPMTTGASPTLTSVDLNLKELGREAAELLFASMAGPVEPGIRRVRGRVVAREST